MIRAALYGRFSSDNQREESIMAQFRDGKAYCKRKGYTIVKTYADEARSGTTTVGRDEYNRMLLDAAGGLFDVVIFHKVDRNARNEFDYYNTKRELEEAGVRYEYSKQEIDSSTPEGQMMESVMVGMAAYYSRNLASEIKKGLRENAYEGKSTGGIPPYGYSTDKEKKWVIDEREAPAIRTIFSMYTEGRSYEEIVQELLKGGYTTRRGTPFKKSSLHDIICNPKYKGTLILGKSTKHGLKRNNHKISKGAQYFDGTIPPIVSIDTWEKAKRIMESKRRRSGAGKAKAVYALTGLIYCGKCGGPMTGQANIDRYGVRRYYYRCRPCKSKMVRRDEIEDIVLETIKKAFLADGAMERIKKIIHDEIEKEGTIDYASQIKKLSGDISRAKMRLNNLYRLIEDGEADEYDISRIKEAKANLTALNQSMKDLKERAGMGTPTDEMVEDVVHNLKEFFETKKDPHEMKALFHLLIKRVEITNDEAVVYLMVTQEGFEPTTHRLEGGCSIQLSY